jgi:hypothetical protein
MWHWIFVGVAVFAILFFMFLVWGWARAASNYDDDMGYD